MAETALTAKFNINIETPSPKDINDYDLDIVISKFGFGEETTYGYSLITSNEQISLSGNILSIMDAAYGDVEILVTGSKDGKSTSASTTLYGFYALRSEAVNSQKFIQKMTKIISDTEKIWPALLGSRG